MTDTETRAQRDRSLRLPALEGDRFDAAFVGILLWFTTGVLLDGRAHTHGADETFFTLEHAIFYSAFVAMGLLLGVRIARNRRTTTSWRAAIPPGYELSLVGIALFAVGGVGDMLWHELFGVEADIEALLSPTHLLLVVGAGLFVSGPVRAALTRNPSSSSLFGRYVPVIAATVTLSLFTFITLYLNPVTEPVASAAHSAAETATATGLAGILVTTTILMTFVLLLVLRFDLPRGSLTLLLGGNALAMAIVNGHAQFVAVFALAGLVADGLYRQLDPSVGRPWSLRLFAAVVPTVLFGAYFLGLWAVTGIAWTLHLWTGAIVTAGLVGLLLATFVGLVQPSVHHSEERYA